MAMDRFVGIGTRRGKDVFDYVLGILESEKPLIVALDENPVAFSTLIQMRSSRALFNEEFIFDQKPFLLKRGLDVGNSAGILYALRQGSVPVYFVDGSFQEALSDTGEETGIYPYFTSIDFASSVDIMHTPVKLRKQRIPTYPGWDFDYELIHAYQTDTGFDEMDRAIWQRNQFSARALNRIIESHDTGALAFIGDSKRFLRDLYAGTKDLAEAELAEYRPLHELVHAREKVFRWETD